jgi:hypothetical protein
MPRSDEFSRRSWAATSLGKSFVAKPSVYKAFTVHGQTGQRWGERLSVNVQASPAEDRDSLDKSSVEAIALADIESEQVQAIVAAWQRLRGMHAMPKRDALSPRDLGHAAAHISLARVIADSDDYEFRIIGDAHVQAYGTSYQGRNVSDVIAQSPRFGRQLKASYDLVRTIRRPYAFRGFIGRDVADARFVWFETAYLPFGDDDTVDHILNAAVYRPRNGSWLGLDDFPRAAARA